MTTRELVDGERRDLDGDTLIARRDTQEPQVLDAFDPLDADPTKDIHNPAHQRHLAGRPLRRATLEILLGDTACAEAP